MTLLATIRRRLNRVTTPMKLTRQISFLAFLISFLLTFSAQAETYYYHNDHLGTPQVLTDQNQDVVWHGEYDPFGGVTKTVATVAQNLRFPGQYLDQETGLHYNYFRTYDPQIGRYLESDPIGLLGGANLYAYVGNDPISFIDPEGKARAQGTKCFNCGAPHGGAFGIYCPSCYDKSKDPNGGVPPLVVDPNKIKINPPKSTQNYREDPDSPMQCTV